MQAKERYVQVASGAAPELLPEIGLPSGMHQLAKVLVLAGLASSK